MKTFIMFLFLICFTITCSSQVFGVNDKSIPPFQEAKAVKAIRERMNSVNETLLNDDTEPQTLKIVIDTIFKGNFYVQQLINLARYNYIDNKLVRLTVVVSNGFIDTGNLHDLINNPSHSIVFYFDGSGLMSVTEQYTNQSRMGSCGSVGITKTLYYRKQKVFWEHLEQNPYPCYSETILDEYYTTVLAKMKIEF